MADRESVRKWVVDNLDKGYKPEQLRQSMNNYGYDERILDEVLRERSEHRQPQRIQEEPKQQAQPQKGQQNQQKLETERAERDRIYDQSGQKRSRNIMHLTKAYALPAIGFGISGMGAFQLGSFALLSPSGILASSAALAALSVVASLRFKKIAYIGILFSLIALASIILVALNIRIPTTAFGIAPISTQALYAFGLGPLILLIANALHLRH